MKRIAIAVLASSVVFTTACSEVHPTATPGVPSLAQADAGTAGNKLQCFSGTEDGGYNGTCTLIKNGADINTVDADADPNNAYAGVYIQNSNLNGKRLSEINKLSFSYSGSGVAGGSPRVTFPIDIDGDGVTTYPGYDDYVTSDALGCGNGAATSGTVDPLNNSACTVSLNGGATYANWSAFLAAFPNARVGDNLPFVIVDQPGTFSITNVQLGRGAAKSKG